MKKNTRNRIATFVVVLSGALFLWAFTLPEGITKTEKLTKDKKPAFVMPENVNKVVMNSCYGCHNSKSKGEKSKKKLNFDKLPTLHHHKMVVKLQDIADVVHDGDMPPKKFLVKHPEKALTKSDKTLLQKWASETAESLMPHHQQ